MLPTPRGGARGALRLAAGMAALLLLVAIAAPGPVRADGEQRTFPSVEEAAKALIAAGEQPDGSALLAIFGPDAQDLIRDPDDPVVRQERAAFLAAAKAKLLA